MAEGKSGFAYVTYIRTTPERLWEALTTPDFIRQYWFGMTCESAWTQGSAWTLVSQDGQVWDAGEILEIAPTRRLVIRWRHQNRPELQAEGPSLCIMELEAIGAAVKLSITHTIERDGSALIEAVSGGWPKIMSNLKSLLETGRIALENPSPAACAEARS